MDVVRFRRTAAAALLSGVLANLVYAATVPLGSTPESVRAAAAERPGLATVAAVLDVAFRLGVVVGALGLAQLARRRAMLATGGAWLVVVGAVCLTVQTALTLVYAESGAADPGQVDALMSQVQGGPAFVLLLVTGFAGLSVGITLLLVALGGDGRRLRPEIALVVLGSAVGLALADVRAAQLVAALLTGAGLVRLALLLLRDRPADGGDLGARGVSTLPGTSTTDAR